jgi:hypothetical protein
LREPDLTDRACNSIGLWAFEVKGPAMGWIAVPPTRSSVLLARERDVSLDSDQENRFAGTDWCRAEDTGAAMCWCFRLPRALI